MNKIEKGIQSNFNALENPQFSFFFLLYRQIMAASITVRFSLLLLLFAVNLIQPCAQSFKQEYKAWKKQYKKNFREDPSSPLGRIGITRLRFFKPNSNFSIPAKLEILNTSEIVSFPTTTGKTMDYIPYAKARFEVYSQPCELTIYKSAKALTQKGYENYLFIPFRDYTCGDESYGGGRYIDLQTSQIQGDKVVIDFNRAYNPYCAYNDMYSCPVPPAENSLPLEIRAGEKNYRKRGRAAKP
jgi:uncharacterized protein (DUF1684 family)